jgi:aspartate/methionine/tyrosine aminotransferase
LQQRRQGTRAAPKPLDDTQKKTEKKHFYLTAGQLTACLPALCHPVSGVAKAFSMTGFRVGWLHGPPALISVAAKMAEVFLSCGVPFAQAAAEAALRGPQDCVVEMARAYAKRRDLALAVVARHGLYEYSPQIAFYLLVPVPGGNADAFAHRLLEERGVAVAPGSSFGGASRAHVRISLASSEAALAEGLGALCAMAAWDRDRMGGECA